MLLHAHATFSLPSMMESLSISGLHTLHMEPIVLPGIPPWPLKKYCPSISSRPLNPSIRWSVWPVTPWLSPQVRVCHRVYPRPDIPQHTHVINVRAIWNSLFVLNKTRNVGLLLFVMDSPHRVHSGPLAVAAASFSTAILCVISSPIVHRPPQPLPLPSSIAPMKTAHTLL